MTKLKEIFIILIFILFGLFIGLFIEYGIKEEYKYVELYGYNFKLELLDAYDNYYETSDILINNYNIDTTSIQYKYYKESKYKLDSLFNTQL